MRAHVVRVVPYFREQEPEKHEALKLAVALPFHGEGEKFGSEDGELVNEVSQKTVC